MRALSTGRVAVILGLAVALYGSRAGAEPTAADKETARRLMAEGRTHRKADDWKGALQSFLAADAIMHVPTTGLEVAKAEAELGQLVEARDKLLAVLRLPVEGDEPRAFTEARATAKGLSAELEGRIPSITIKIHGGSDNAARKVTIDGVEVPLAALNAPRAVDPGHHVVALQVGSGDPHETQVDVQETETKDVSLDAGTSDQPSTDEETTPKPSDTTTPTPAAAKWRLASYVGFGVGGAGLIMGSITGILAISDFNSAKQLGCVNNNCPPAAYPGLDKAGTMATLSTVGFIVAGVGAGVGVLSFVMSKRAGTPPSTSETALRMTPTLDVYLAPGSAGVHGSF